MVEEIRRRHRSIVEAMLPALRRARYKRQIPQRALAEMIGVSPSLIEAWELGRRVPAPDMLSRWRDLLGC